MGVIKTTGVCVRCGVHVGRLTEAGKVSGWPRGVGGGMLGVCWHRGLPPRGAAENTGLHSDGGGAPETRAGGSGL